jgi:hypothetical protein
LFNCPHCDEEISDCSILEIETDPDEQRECEEYNSLTLDQWLRHGQGEYEESCMYFGVSGYFETAKYYPYDDVFVADHRTQLRADDKIDKYHHIEVVSRVTGG